MHILDIIEKKKRSLELTREEIFYVVNGYVSGEIKDYQMSSFLMAVCLNSMTDNETAILTESYVKSGDIIDLSELKSTVDKHSTGGVGDKTTLVIGPILAALGINVAKFSGRGLGHTGGTVDKLESLNGFSTELSMDDFLKQVKDINIAIAGQTAKLVVADKLIYALRDVTATVDSIPLIAASIMSKKIASGANVIILDVKVGSGAFMKTLEDAEKLAKTMVNIGNNLNKKTVAIISDMDQPLGKAIGNSNEIIEAINFLNGEYIDDLGELTYQICAEALTLENIAKDYDEACMLVDKVIKDKSAYNKFVDFITYQGASEQSILDLKLPNSEVEILSEEEGYIEKVDAIALGDVARKLGAGRLTKDDVIDSSCGIIVNVKVGDYVKDGDLLVTVQVGDKSLDDELIAHIAEAIKLSNSKVEKQKTILKVVK